MIKLHWMTMRKIFHSPLVFALLAASLAAGSWLLCDLAIADADAHLVVVHDQGGKTIIKTKADTVGDVLKEAGLSLSKADKVEPATDEEILVSNYNINIYRGQPAVVVDGARKTKLLTPAGSPEEVAAAAGVELKPKDKLEYRLTDDFSETGVNFELVVRRAKTIKFTFYGKKLSLRTQAQTVREFLKEQHITLGKNDFTKPALDTKLANGSKLELWRNGVKTHEVEETIKPAVRQVNDYDRPFGYRKVVKPGKKGERTVVYRVTMKNGKVTKRQKLSQVVTKQPVTQVEVVGAKASLPPSSKQCKAWAKEAGVSEANMGYALQLIFRESGCRVNANNAGSGAYGIPQALPGNKMASAGSDWQTNPVTQIRWMQGYVNSRWGGWKSALDQQMGSGWY
jgi:uncharacterized protein YabE (DUF348 family)